MKIGYGVPRPALACISMLDGCAVGVRARPEQLQSEGLAGGVDVDCV